MESSNMLWLFLLGLFGVAFDHNQPLLRLLQYSADSNRKKLFSKQTHTNTQERKKGKEKQNNLTKNLIQRHPQET